MLGFDFFSSTIGTIDSVKSILTQSALDALCEKYYILDVVHPELLGRNDRIRNSPIGGGDVAEANQTEKGEHVVDVGGIDVVVDDEVQAIVADKPQRVRKKRKAADGASGSGLPPKKLRRKQLLYMEDHFQRSVVILQTPSCINRNVTDDEVTFVIRDSASPSMDEADVAGPSQPVGIELLAGSFYVSQDMDPETLRQIYIPKWNVINDSVLDDPDVFRGMIDHLAPPGFFSLLQGMDYEQMLAEFDVGTAR
ncbi:hypothetical protein Tco_0696560 [Tanacetum coccineum]